MIIWRYQASARLLNDPSCNSLAIEATAQSQIGVVRLDGSDFDRTASFRHDDVRGHVALASSQGDSLGVIAYGGSLEKANTITMHFATYLR